MSYEPDAGGGMCGAGALAVRGTSVRTRARTASWSSLASDTPHARHARTCGAFTVWHIAQTFGSDRITSSGMGRFEVESSSGKNAACGAWWITGGRMTGGDDP